MTTGVPARPDVLDPQFHVDPWRAYEWLRDEAPVYWDPVQRLWVISRYDDVVAVERDGRRGFGTHFCLGAHLARLEIRVMFEVMLRRMPAWSLVDPNEPRIVPATFARAYDRIRIRWTPAR